jgi:hypothetical protein
MSSELERDERDIFFYCHRHDKEKSSNSKTPSSETFVLSLPERSLVTATMGVGNVCGCCVVTKCRDPLLLKRIYIGFGSLRPYEITHSDFVGYFELRDDIANMLCVGEIAFMYLHADEGDFTDTYTVLIDDNKCHNCPDYHQFDNMEVSLPRATREFFRLHAEVSI